MTIHFFVAPSNEESEVVNLSWHGFADLKSKMTREEFLERLINLDEKTEELDLSANQLGFCDLAFLLTMLGQIEHKPKLVKLNLAFNRLEKMTLHESVLFFTKIPASVQQLDLNGNKFENWPKDDFITLLKAIPHSVISIKMSDTLLSSITLDEIRASSNDVQAI